MIRALLALAALAVPATAFAETVAIPFAPPLGKALHYRIDQQRALADRPVHFVTDRDVRFEKEGDVLLLVATLRRLDTDAPSAQAAPYRAALQPLTGVEMRFVLDPAGRIASLRDGDAVWAKVTGGLADMLRTLPEKSEDRAAALRVRALFDSLGAEGRIALLAGEYQPLFLFAGSGVEDGPGRGVRTVAGSPLARPVPVEGTLRVTGRAPDALDLEEKLAGQGVELGVRYRLSTVTGLVERQDRTLAAGPRTLTENRTLTPAD